MHGDIAAALLEFLAGPTWARIVAPDLWRCSAKSTHFVQWLGLMRSQSLEVAVNSCGARRSRIADLLNAIQALPWSRRRPVKTADHDVSERQALHAYH